MMMLEILLLIVMLAGFDDAEYGIQNMIMLAITVLNRF